MINYLECVYDKRKSFYKKAKVESIKTSFEQTKDLFSYNTLVARVHFDFVKMIITYNFFGFYSQTTTRHQKEFFKQNYLNDEEIKELFKKGTIKRKWEK